MRTLQVVSVVLDGTSVGRAIGTDTRTGEAVAFAGEPRMLADLAECLYEGGEMPVVQIEDWQVVGASR
jgi:hypothetical protein